MTRGKYIVIESGEGGGKTTQARTLTEYFMMNNVPVAFCREPGSTPEAEQIRKILLDEKNRLNALTELFLFEAARIEFFKKTLIPNLDRGTNVIADRSCYSTEAYQGYAGGLDLDMIKQFNKIATDGVKPDLMFIIDVEAKRGLEKENAPDRFASKGLSYHEKVNEGYRKVAKENPDFCILIPYRDGDIDGMQNEIRKHVKERLGIPRE